MVDYICTLQNVGKVVPPKRQILKDISLSFFYGAKIGILGLNGAGKSTLLKIIAGIEKDIQGECTHKKGINIGYLAQEPKLDNTKNVRANVEEGVGKLQALLNRFNEISAQFAQPLDEQTLNELLEEQGELQNQIDAQNGWELERQLEQAAEALRLPPWEASVSNLSGGERRRIALCRLLLSEPDLLLLDEPTNHLDAESIAWLERYLDKFKGTVVAITHDRYFLDKVAGWILELDRGEGMPFEGNYSNWLSQKERRLQMEAKQEAAHKRTLKSELEWVQKSPKGRHAKNKARIARFEELSSKEFQKRNETNELYIPPGPRLGDLVLEFNDISKGFQDKLLIESLSFRVPKGAMVGIIGPNGAGKTTLFKLITGQLTPDSGNLRIGETVKLAYVDQSRDSLEGHHSVWEEISGGVDIMTIGQYEMASRAYVGRFNFKGSDQQKLIKNLSGGERNRVHLAKVLKSGGNMILLDEPTNDLDVETLRALEEALLTFPGCGMIISHDRWFLDRIATHILAFEEQGSIHWFEGTYSEYEENRLKTLGEAALQPHRLKYKKFHSV